MALIKPVNPQINWGNKITKGLVIDSPIFERSGSKTIDLVSKIYGSFSNTPVWVTGLWGQALRFNGNGTGAVVDFPLAPNQRSTTQISFMTITTLRGAGGGNFGRHFSETNNTTSGVTLIDIDTTQVLRFQFPFTGAVGTWDCPTGTIGGGPNIVIVTYDASNIANIPIIWLNGKKLVMGTLTAPVGTAVFNDSHLLIGNISQTGNVFTRAYNGDINLLRKWNRILSAQEAKALTANPWQIYKKPRVSDLLNIVASTISTLKSNYRHMPGRGHHMRF